MIGDIKPDQPKSPTAEDTRAAIDAFTAIKPTHTLITPPGSESAARRAVGDAWLGLDVEVVASPYLPDGTAYLFDRSALEIQPPPTLTWDRPDANPLADIWAAWRLMGSAPYVPFTPIFTPSAARIYNREMRRIRFLKELERRWIADKRLRPMRVEYRRRARRRGRR